MVSVVWDAEEFEDDPGGTVFRDVLMLTLVGFMAMVILMLPHLSRSEDQTQEQKAPGSVVVEIHWPGQMPADVDLWVQAPNDIPVGFFNQNGTHFNLLRDDLGVERRDPFEHLGEHAGVGQGDGIADEIASRLGRLALHLVPAHGVD